MTPTPPKAIVSVRRTAAAKLYARVVQELVCDSNGDCDYDLPASWHELDLTQFPGLSVSPDMSLDEWLEELTSYLNLTNEIVQRDLSRETGPLEGVERILKNGF